MNRLLLVCFFLLLICSLHPPLKGQGGIVFQGVSEGFILAEFVLEDRPFFLVDVGSGERRHYEIHELIKDSLVWRYHSASGRQFWKLTTDSLGNVFIVSMQYLEPMGRYYVSRLNVHAAGIWEFTLDDGFWRVTRIVADGQGGCHLGLVGEGYHCLHLDALGRRAESVALGPQSGRSAHFQFDLSQNGVAGFVTTRSELTGRVNSCTPDFDCLGFVASMKGTFDTLFFTDMHPYTNHHLHEMVASPPGGKIFLMDVVLPMDPQKSSILHCSDTAGAFVNFQGLPPEDYPLLHRNQIQYGLPKDGWVQVWDIAHRNMTSMRIDPAQMGYPQRFMTSWEEDGLIWNAIGTDVVTKILVDGSVAWKARIPYPVGFNDAVLVHMGYLGDGGYFFVAMGKRAERWGYFEMDAGGRWR